MTLRPRDIHVAVVSQNADVATDIRPCAVAAALADRGFRVTLVGPTVAADARPAVVHPAVTFQRFALPRAAAGAAGQVVEQAVSTARLARALLEISRRSPVHVVHAGNPPDNGWIFPLLLGAARRERPLLVYDQHDPAPLVAADKFGSAGAMSAVGMALRLLERAALSRSALAVFANDPFLERARALGFVGPAVVVPNGWPLVDPAGDAPPWRVPELPLLAYVGTINGQDGVANLVHAVPRLRTRVQVAVAGDGDARHAAESLAHELGVAERFVWLGWVRDRAAIARLVSAADVCVAPEAPSPANDLTSFVKLVEYMSLGAAVAAHRLPQTERVVGDAVEYAADGTPGALADAIERLLADPARAADRGRAARARFDEKLRWDAVGACRLGEAYERVVVPAVERRAGSWRGRALLVRRTDGGR